MSPAVRCSGTQHKESALGLSRALGARQSVIPLNLIPNKNMPTKLKKPPCPVVSGLLAGVLLMGISIMCPHACCTAITQPHFIVPESEMRVKRNLPEAKTKSKKPTKPYAVRVCCGESSGSRTPDT
jgi:hypothetical protein